MIAAKEHITPKTATSPVTQPSSVANRLIPLRESLLNRISRTSQAPVLNNKVATEPQKPAADLAGHIRTALGQLKATAMDPGGTAVAYSTLRHSDTYAALRQEALAQLRTFDPQQLPSLNAARAFWINLYNALVIDAVINFGVQESVTAGHLGVLTFFRRAAYLVGGQRLSLEDIEHGILRGNRGNPYMPGPHFSANDPRLAWSLPLDPRLHFALNCGGRSCPAIRAYGADKLDQQLDLAARSFISATVAVDPERKVVSLSTIFRWYAADFGQCTGIAQLLTAYLPDDERRSWLLAAGSDLRFTYSPYDWRLNML
jgi:hypothetical protein